MEKKALYDSHTGIHRAKVWEIALFACNNVSSNIHLVLFGTVAYFLNGIAGISLAVSSTVVMLMRMWDGVTDPMIGYVLDKTNSKFGKNRPFIIIGNIILFVFSGLIFYILPIVAGDNAQSANQGLVLALYIILYMLYIFGYTAQCVVTKSAQTALTNDPHQRPVFTIFDTIYNSIVFAFIPLIQVNILVPLYATGNYARNPLGNPGLAQNMWLIFAPISFGLACLAVVGLWRKDRVEFFGVGKAVKIRMKDYWEVLKKNRAIQMLVVSAASDKLAGQVAGNSSVVVLLLGVVVGDYAQQGFQSAVITWPNVIFSVLAIMFVATRLGQKKALIIGTLGAMAGATGLLLIFVLGNPTDLDMSFSNGITLFTAAYIVLLLSRNASAAMSGGIVIPMTADCADYEVYRSGKYVPGLMGTLFSFVDKMISSLGAVIVSWCLIPLGFTGSKLPQPNYPNQVDPIVGTEFTNGILWMTMFLYVGVPMLGWVCNLVSMKFYPLNKEKMAEIQEEIAEIKKRTLAEANESAAKA